jgi:hypothetical protein
MVMDGRWVAMPYYNVRSPTAQVSATFWFPDAGAAAAGPTPNPGDAAIGALVADGIVRIS